MGIKLGQHNTLKVVESTPFGVVLDGGDLGGLLLPKKECPSKSKMKDSVEVFLYFDSKENVVPTTKKPFGSVETFACLEVVSVSEIGAFMDWGLPKDLFVPIGEQAERMKEGEWHIVYIHKDPRRNRLAASSKLDKFLDKTPVSYRENECVNLMVCYKSDLGYEAIINDAHLGLVYTGEVFRKLEYGERVDGYIKKVREDGKIDLSLQKLGYQASNDLEQQILKRLEVNNGRMDVTDKSAPEKIYELFGVSKKKYKMALGALYKSKKIVIQDDIIKLTG